MDDAGAESRQARGRICPPGLRCPIPLYGVSPSEARRKEAQASFACRQVCGRFPTCSPRPPAAESTRDPAGTCRHGRHRGKLVRKASEEPGVVAWGKGDGESGAAQRTQGGQGPVSLEPCLQLGPAPAASPHGGCCVTGERGDAFLPQENELALAHSGHIPRPLPCGRPHPWAATRPLPAASCSHSKRCS